MTKKNPKSFREHSKGQNLVEKNIILHTYVF